LSKDRELSSPHTDSTANTALYRTRSSLLACSLLAAVVAWPPSQAEASLHRKSKRVDEAKKEQPISPKGPLIISIAIANQHLTVFDGSAAIAHAPVSTGMSGHPTPMGVFSVIQKQKWHQSNIYSGAPMPYMQRITWSGVAMHAGVLPGYPASHGCIRMPHDFAVRLYGMTKVGVRVFVTRNDVTPTPFADPHLFTPKPPEAPQAASPIEKQSQGKVDGRVASTDMMVAVADNASSSDANSVPVPAAKDAAKVDPATAQSPPAAPVASEPAPASTDPTKVDPSKTQSAQAGSDASAPAATPQTTDVQPTGETADVPLPLARPQVPPIKPAPISVFISKKLSKLFVREGFESVFTADIKVDNPERPLGTHVFTATDFTDDHSAMKWLVVSLPSEVVKKEERHAEKGSRKHRDSAAKAQSEPQPAETAAGALARIEIPAEARERVAELLTPGSSLIVTDKDLGPETGESGETDFIVVTR
jgi:lipoprotein-anchoring transpeptidase ErfK/SrfK